MSRLPRIHIPGIPLHIVQRGNFRHRTFFEDEDYRTYLRLLARFSQRYETRIHAYVLMSNHVHLLVTSSHAGGISATMQHLASTYSRQVNERLERKGSLWEGRFLSSPVESDFYCLACYRYIELNPVRAGIVAAPEEYHWSSYHENVGRHAWKIVVPHACFLALGPSPGARAESYRAIVRERLSGATIDAIRERTRKGVPVGREIFTTIVEAETGYVLGPKKRGRPRKISV